MLRYLWTLAAERIREKVADAPPSYLIESRAASAERVRVTAELVDHHSTTLETLLAALRSPALSDDAARKSATDVAARALVGLRTLNDRTTELVEEPVATAFQRLREDLAFLAAEHGSALPPVTRRQSPCRGERRPDLVQFRDGDPADDRFVSGLLLRPARAVLGEDDQGAASQIGEGRLPQPLGNGGQRGGGQGGNGFQQDSIGGFHLPSLRRHRNRPIPLGSKYRSIMALELPIGRVRMNR
jgi:hypothetical protein